MELLFRITTPLPVQLLDCSLDTLSGSIYTDRVENPGQDCAPSVSSRSSEVAPHTIAGHNESSVLWSCKRFHCDLQKWHSEPNRHMSVQQVGLHGGLSDQTTTESQGPNGRTLTGALRYLRYAFSVVSKPNKDPPRTARTNTRVIAMMGAEKFSGNLSRASSMPQMMSCVNRKSKTASNPSLIPVTVSGGHLDIHPLNWDQFSANAIVVLSIGRKTSETTGQAI